MSRLYVALSTGWALLTGGVGFLLLDRVTSTTIAGGTGLVIAIWTFVVFVQQVYDMRRRVADWRG
jgi:hypothetical protein